MVARAHGERALNSGAVSKKDHAFPSIGPFGFKH